MLENLEELKKEWIVDEEEIFKEKSKLAKLVKRMMNYCKVTKSGDVIINDNYEGITIKEKVCLYAMARFLANKLDENIPREVKADEIAESLMIDRRVVMARLKDLKDEKYLIRESRGIYHANPSKIEAFLHELDKKYGSKE